MRASAEPARSLPVSDPAAAAMMGALRGVSATPPSEAELARADELVVCRNAFSQHDTAGRGEFTTTRLHTES